jgi:hypothetical protein
VGNFHGTSLFLALALPFMSFVIILALHAFRSNLFGHTGWYACKSKSHYFHKLNDTDRRNIMVGASLDMHRERVSMGESGTNHCVCHSNNNNLCQHTRKKVGSLLYVSKESFMFLFSFTIASSFGLAVKHADAGLLLISANVAAAFLVTTRYKKIYDKDIIDTPEYSDVSDIGYYEFTENTEATMRYAESKKNIGVVNFATIVITVFTICAIAVGTLTQVGITDG